MEIVVYVILQISLVTNLVNKMWERYFIHYKL